MQNTTWRQLLALVPAKLHNNLVVATSVGIELAIQDIIQVHPEYLVIRGRMAGTSDAGRLFIVPFAQICYLGLAKLVRDEEISEMFGSPAAPPAAASLVYDPQAPAPEPASEAPLKAESASESPPEPPPRTVATPVKFPNRAELLQRIRSRQLQQNPQAVTEGP